MSQTTATRETGLVMEEAEISSHPEEFERREPRAGAMLEALRSVGYSIETAIADLIDNSISAGARNVWLTFFWAGEDSHIQILDDGAGMSESELSEAMRPGSSDPLEERQPADLGRFGLGLKTASFSQARRLTVGSRKENGHLAIRRWDLDHVRAQNDWQLLKSPAPGASQYLRPLESLPSGTLVLWEQMDRVVGNASVSDRHALNRFNDMINRVENHLAMVFHRFLETDAGAPALRLFINGDDARHRVKAWDPFLSGHPATQRFPDESLKHRGVRVRVTGFVLPHKDKLDEDEFTAGAGPAGWNAHQGFYVYREKRLLVAGEWLGLGFQREEHYKLARLQIDIPNATDGEWDIDVKKSRARPPAELAPRLKELAEQVRRRAREVFVHRGARTIGATPNPVDEPWESIKKDGRRAYRVRREHPLVRFVLERQGADRKPFVALLKLLEETVPVQRIWLDTAEEPDLHAEPFDLSPPAEVWEVLNEMYRALRGDGHTETMAKNRLSLLPLFSRYGETIRKLADD